MALDIAALLEQTGALQQGHFRLSSGLHSPTYVQCALLLQHPREAKAIGQELARAIGSHPSRIVSPALGGVIIGYTVADTFHVPFAFTERNEGRMTLRRGFRIERDEPVIIVEDVVTTGKSTRETASVVEQHGGKVIGFASILNRSGTLNPFDAPYASLLSLALETYEESRCPLCARGVPVVAPGSRFGAAKA